MNTSQTPLVSVIIPAYNSAKFAAKAVESVLAQTYQNYELIVIDDGSTDNTKEVLNRFAGRVNYIFQENRGPSAARNMGIKVAQGEYICFLDADDTWLPMKLEVQLAFMKNNRGIVLLFSDEEETDDKKMFSPSVVAERKFYSNIISQRPIQEAFKTLLIENYLPT